MGAPSDAILQHDAASATDAAARLAGIGAEIDRAVALREAQPARARELAEEACAQLHQVPDDAWDQEAIRCLFHVGDLRIRVGAVPESVEVLLQAIELLAERGDDLAVDPVLEHHLHERLSVVYCKLGLYSYALAESNLALLIAQGQDDPNLLASTWSTIAQIHLSLSDRGGAAGAADRAVQAATLPGADRASLGIAHLFAMLASTRHGRYDDARRHAAAAEGFRSELPRAERAGLEIAHGEMQVRMGNGPAAEAHFLAALAEVEGSSLQYALFSALTGLAGAKLLAGDHVATRDLVRQALALNDVTVALTLRCERMMAVSLEQLGDLAGALAWEKRVARSERRMLHASNEERFRVLDLEHRATIAEQQAEASRNRAEFAEQERRRSAARYEALIEGAADLVSVVNRDGTVRWVSPSAWDVLGVRAEDLVGHRPGEQVFHEDRSVVGAAFQQAVQHPGLPSTPVEYRIRHRDGTWRYISAVITDLHHDPAIGGLMYVATDTTPRRWHEALVASQAAVLDLITRDCPLDEVLARLILTIHEMCSASVVADVRWATEPDAPDDDPEPTPTRHYPLDDPTGRTVGTLTVRVLDGHDVTDTEQQVIDRSVQLARIGVERSTSAASIAHQATHDHLTGLPNRFRFEGLTAAAIRARATDGPPLAVLFLDLDRFKLVNDGLGHDIGDRLLGQVTSRIRDCLEPGDVAARFGGDEFTILRPVVASFSDLVGLADELIEAIRTPFVLDSAELCLSASIGITLCRDPGADASRLVTEADAAMFRAKERGRDRSELFDDSMRVASDERLRWGAALRHAVDRDQLRLEFQPIVDLRSGAVTGHEALVRWQSMDFGLVPPGAFIPLAEETGLIVSIGEWVIDQAAAAIRRQATPLPIWVNLSANQISHPSLLPAVRAAIAGHAIDASLLCFEITETAIGIDLDTAVDRIRLLRDLGARIAIDDFGTGYSSLDRLQSLPINVLKIDRSFVAGVDASTRRQSLLQAILGLSGSLGMDSVAEGVETAAELACLLDCGCDLAQGYLFAHPGPLVEHPPYALHPTD